MPGLSGFITAASDAPLNLAAMVPPLVPHPWFVVEKSDDGPFQSVAVSLDRAGRKPKIAVSECENFHCVLDGEFYNSPELQRQNSRAVGTPEPSDSQLLLSGWRERGTKFVQQINGSFSAVIWDAQQQTATLLTDRFGNRPLYYSLHQGSFVFSSAVKSIVAATDDSLDIDPRGFAQFFTFGHYLNCDTSLRSVKILPAAAHWTWSSRTQTLQQNTYDTTPSVGQSPRTNQQWIGDIGDAFQAAVERQTRNTSNLGLALSGGLDARTVLAAIDIKRSPLKTVCLGIQGSLDHRCAGRLARLAGCENHSHILDTGFLRDYRRHLDWMVRLTDGQYLSQCIVIPTLALYRKLGVEVLLRGHAGELMHMYKAYNYSLDEAAFQIGSREQLNQWLFKRLSAYMLAGVTRPVFRSDLQTDLDRLARESLASDVEATSSSETPTQQIWQLFMTQRLRRETVLSLNEFRSVVETRLPFLDNDLIPLLMAAPPELKLGEEIQAALLKRFRPEFLGVVNANTGTKVGAGPFRRKVASLTLRALAKLGVPGYQPYERLGLWLKRDLRDLVQEVLLAPETLDRGIYQADGVRAVIENHQAGRANHTYLIMALLIFELGLRYLGHSDSTAEPVLAIQGTESR